MARIGHEGFSMFPVLKPGWTASTPANLSQVAGLYTQNKVVQSTNACTLKIPLSVALNSFFIGFSRVVPNGDIINANSMFQMQGDAGSVAHLTFDCSTTGQLIVRRGTSSGTILATSAVIFSVNARYYFEIFVVISDTVGRVKVKVNDVVVIDFTGDTKNAGTLASIDTFVNLSAANSGVSTFGDLVYRDNTGAAPYNDFMGEQLIMTLDPNNNGATNQFLGSDGNSVDNYLLVDENPPNTTDYTGDSTAGHRDLYEFTDLVPAGTVHAASAHAYMQKTDAGARSVKILNRSGGGTLNSGASQTLSTTYTVISSALLTADADAAAWTVAKINAEQFGVETV